MNFKKIKTALKKLAATVAAVFALATFVPMQKAGAQEADQAYDVGNPYNNRDVSDAMKKSMRAYFNMFQKSLTFTDKVSAGEAPLGLTIPFTSSASDARFGFLVATGEVSKDGCPFFWISKYGTEDSYFPDDTTGIHALPGRYAICRDDSVKPSAKPVPVRP